MYQMFKEAAYGWNHKFHFGVDADSKVLVDL